MFRISPFHCSNLVFCCCCEIDVKKGFSLCPGDLAKCLKGLKETNYNVMNWNCQHFAKMIGDLCDGSSVQDVLANKPDENLREVSQTQMPEFGKWCNSVQSVQNTGTNWLAYSIVCEIFYIQVIIFFAHDGIFPEKIYALDVTFPALKFCQFDQLHFQKRYITQFDELHNFSEVNFPLITLRPQLAPSPPSNFFSDLT